MPNNWIDVDDYTLDARRGPLRRPVLRLDLVAKTTADPSKQYELRIRDGNDRVALARKAMATLGEIWPVRRFQIKANRSDVITSIRKHPSG